MKEKKSKVLSQGRTAVWHRKVRANDPEKKMRELEKHRNKYHHWKSVVLAALGNKCSSCGFLDSRALQIDHILGGGNKEKREFSKGSTGGYCYTYLRSILEDPEFLVKYQLLCANCNWIKRHENNENKKRFVIKGK